MRRLFVAVTLCTAFLLLAIVASGALATTLHKSGGAPAGELARLHTQSGATASWVGAQPRFVPAPEAIGAVAAINGTLRDYYGSALSSAAVDWYIGASSSGSGTTDGAGLYSFSGVPAASGNGEVTATSSDNNTWYDWWNLTWPAPGPTTFDMQPGGVTVSATPGGPWPGSSIGTDVYTSAGTERKDTYQWFPGATSVKAPALPGTVEGIGVYFWTDEGAEASTVNGQVVATASTLAQSVSVDEASAQRVWTGGINYKTNPWGSGKPGSKLKVWLQNYPTSWTNHINGYSQDPRNSAQKTFGNFRSLSTNPHSRTLTIPAKAVPGYSYRIWLTHTDGPLQLGTWFQVCTLKSSKASVSKGAAVRLSGIVPVQGHKGSTAGQRTKVYCLWHKGTAAQPTKLDPSKNKGWHMLGYVKSNGYGAYRTPQIRLGATATFVMFYGGDDWYNAAYTSPVKVTVR
jgi:hypothetical protein